MYYARDCIILQYCAARLHTTLEDQTDLADEPKVVAHKHHTPLERIDCIG